MFIPIQDAGTYKTRTFSDSSARMASGWHYSRFFGM